MGVTEQLARLALETPSAAFDDALIESAKLRLLDTIGIAIAGSREASTQIALDTVRHLGGAGQATVIGHPDRTSAPFAGYVNGTSAHSQEYDDFTKGADSHVSVVLVPGALALAEDLDVSGRRLLDGFIVGFEIASRIGRGLAPALLDRGWHPNGILGGIGVATAGARMMGLDLTKTRMAIGIAASEASGLRKNVGSMGKAFHVGLGARNGAFAAFLAQRGYQVDPDIIEPSDTAIGGHQRFGLAEAISGPGGYNLAEMVDGLGTRWELTSGRTIVCFHPGSTAPAAALDAVLDLVAAHDVTPSQVAEIQLEVTPQAHAVACYPTAPDPYRARYCLPWSVAVALIDRKAGLAQYSQARIDRGDVQPLMDRVKVTVPPDFAHHKGAWGVNGVNWAEMRVTFRLTDGRILKNARSWARGWTEEPAGWDDIAEKYRECCEGILAPAQRDTSLAMIAEIERLADIRPLMAMLRVG